MRTVGKQNWSKNKEFSEFLMKLMGFGFWL
jgi:hypothetical protein